MHKNSPLPNGSLTYLHSDHLGSTVLTTDTSNNPTGDQRYYAYGKQRDFGPVATAIRWLPQFTASSQHPHEFVWQ